MQEPMFRVAAGPRRERLDLTPRSAPRMGPGPNQETGGPPVVRR